MGGAVTGRPVPQLAVLAVPPAPRRPVTPTGTCVVVARADPGDVREVGTAALDPDGHRAEVARRVAGRAISELAHLVVAPAPGAAVRATDAGVEAASRDGGGLGQIA